MGPRFRTSSPLAASADFRRQIEDLRPYLLRYASLQLRDAAAAEDAVQEALLAALAGESNFAGRSNLRTWLTGILKHKIVDAIRRQSRERTAAEPDPGSDCGRVRRPLRPPRPLGGVPGRLGAARRAPSARSSSSRRSKPACARCPSAPRASS